MSLTQIPVSILCICSVHYVTVISFFLFRTACQEKSETSLNPFGNDNLLEGFSQGNYIQLFFNLFYKKGELKLLMMSYCIISMSNYKPENVKWISIACFSFTFVSFLNKNERHAPIQSLICFGFCQLRTCVYRDLNSVERENDMINSKIFKPSMK